MSMTAKKLNLREIFSRKLSADEVRCRMIRQGRLSETGVAPNEPVSIKCPDCGEKINPFIRAGNNIEYSCEATTECGECGQMKDCEFVLKVVAPDCFGRYVDGDAICEVCRPRATRAICEEMSEREWKGK